jgi:dipeptidyl-peptidase III
LKEHIYALEPEPSLFIGKRSLGQVSNYYPGLPITDDEVAAVQTAAEKIGIDILNTRYASPSATCVLLYNRELSRSVQKNGPTDFVLLIASADTQPDVVHNFTHDGGDSTLTVRYGDFSGPLSRTVRALTEVRPTRKRAVVDVFC